MVWGQELTAADVGRTEYRMMIQFEEVKYRRKSKTNFNTEMTSVWDADCYDL